MEKKFFFTKIDGAASAQFAVDRWATLTGDEDTSIVETVPTLAAINALAPAGQ
jgi:hypothetical protein